MDTALRWVAAVLAWVALWPKQSNTTSSQSVLKIQVGEEIKLTGPGLALLFKAFLAKIEAKFL
jgi:hypothetical protein